MPSRDVSNPTLEVLWNNGQLWELPGQSRAELFAFTLADNATVHRWTSWPSDLDWSGHTFLGRGQKLQRTKWNVTNTMEVPELTVRLLSLNDDFNGGPAIKRQIRNGLFRGATFMLQDLYMPQPADRTLWGTVYMFGGVVAGVTIEGAEALLTIRGKNNLLDQNAPRAIYQSGCFNGFCDPSCTLAKASFTASYSLGSSPTGSFLPWASAPGSPELYIGGEVTFTSGAATGQARDVVAADSSGLTLEYPLYDMPTAGDTFDAVEGCNYQELSVGDGRSCADRGNTQNYFGFRNIPPPTTAY